MGNVDFSNNVIILSVVTQIAGKRILHNIVNEIKTKNITFLKAMATTNTPPSLQKNNVEVAGSFLIPSKQL